MAASDDRTTQIIRHHWDRRADTFDAEAGHGLLSEEQRQAWLSLLGRLAGSASLDALDVGCGTGFLALRLAELGHTVTGIDLSAGMIERANAKANEAGLTAVFRVGDAVALDCSQESFDLVVARHVIWNLADPQRGLSEWLRVLRPGGRILLIEGKWADNEALQRSLARPGSRLFAKLIDIAAGLLQRAGRAPTKLLSFKYRRVEAELPFSGGPSAGTLVEFLRSNSVRDVSSEPLMDAALWGEAPEFERYVVIGTRPS